MDFLDGSIPHRFCRKYNKVVPAGTVPFVTQTKMFEITKEDFALIRDVRDKERSIGINPNLNFFHTDRYLHNFDSMFEGYEGPVYTHTVFEFNP